MKSVEGYTEKDLLVSILGETVREDVSDVLYRAFATLGHTYTYDDDDDGDIVWEFFAKGGGEPLENKIILLKNCIHCSLYNDIQKTFSYDIDDIKKVIELVDRYNDEAYYMM